jgi:endonuclease-3
VLSAHAAPGRRDAAFGALRRNRALTPDAMFRAPKKKLEESVALAGSYTEHRLSALAVGVDRFRRSPNLGAAIRGPLAPALRALRHLPQMGEGGAYRMLLFAADRGVLPVDSTIRRVASRLGYGRALDKRSASARSIRLAITAEAANDRDTLRQTFLYLAHHGTTTCTEQEPHCAICPLRRDCPYAQRTADHLRS